jgi:hypothetical protein
MLHEKATPTKDCDKGKCQWGVYGLTCDHLEVLDVDLRQAVPKGGAQGGHGTRHRVCGSHGQRIRLPHGSYVRCAPYVITLYPCPPAKGGRYHVADLSDLPASTGECTQSCEAPTDINKWPPRTAPCLILDGTQV